MLKLIYWVALAAATYASFVFYPETDLNRVDVALEAVV